MSTAELLVEGAVSWRGKPGSYSPGLLPQVAPRLSAALTFYLAEHTENPHADALTSEYLTGLIFNADYAALEGLATLFESWVYRPGFAVHFPETGFAPADVMLPPVLLLPKPSEYGRETSSSRYPDVIELGDYYWYFYWREMAYWQRPPNYIFGLFYVRWGPGPTVTQYGWTWGSDIRDGAFTPLKSTGPIDPVTFDVAVVERPDTSVLSRDLKTDLSAYLAGETAYSRNYPEPALTAAAENGYVFANWAQEKFGSPEAP